MLALLFFQKKKEGEENQYQWKWISFLVNVQTKNRMKRLKS